MPERNRVSLSFLIISVALVVALLAWNGYSRYRDYRDHQDALSQHLAVGAASEIALQVRELRHRVALFAEEEGPLLARVAQGPGSGADYAELERLVGRHFESHVAFAATAGDGEPLVHGAGARLGQECRDEIRAFAQGDAPYQVYIHPMPGSYHFDVMAPWKTASDAQGVFFVSFPPALLSRVLRYSEPQGHRFLLLHREDRGLIEVTSRGARDVLGSDVRLSPAELERIAVRVPVEGTRWVLADLPEAGLHRATGEAIARDTGLFVAILVVLSVLMARFLKRAEGRRLVAESNLRRAHHELELRVRDRTHRLSEANAELRELFEQHRVAERTLREREETLRIVLETTVDAIVIINEAGTVLTFNRAAERLFGYGREEVEGHNVRMLMPPGHADYHDTYLARYIETGERHIIGSGRVVEGKHKDGTLIPLHLGVSEAKIGRQHLFTGILRPLPPGAQEGEADPGAD